MHMSHSKLLGMTHAVYTSAPRMGNRSKKQSKNPQTDFRTNLVPLCCGAHAARLP